MTKRSYECAACHRPAPSGRCTFIRGVPLGPTCLLRLQRREYIRANGPNSKVIYNEETKLIHMVSDYADLCPDNQTHCLQCPHLTDEACPAEIKHGHHFLG